MTTSATPALRWWLLQNGATLGPFTHAYVTVCVQSGALQPETLACPLGSTEWKSLTAWNAFELRTPPTSSSDMVPSPVTAMPCVDRDQRCQAVESWPPPVMAELIDSPPPTVPIEFPATPLIQVNPRRANTAARIPDNVQFAVTYAKFISPALFALFTFSCVALGPSFVEESPFFGMEIFVFLSLTVVDLFARGLLFFGAFHFAKSPKEGSGLMALGGWIFLLTSGVDFLVNLLLGMVAAGAEEGHETEASGAEVGFSCITCLAGLAELGFVIYMLVVLQGFRERLRASI